MKSFYHIFLMIIHVFLLNLINNVKSDLGIDVNMNIDSLKSSSTNSLERKDKIKRLSSCLKLSKQRQKEDSQFYNELLYYVNEYSKDDNKVGDFIALTIITCYKNIIDEQAHEILEDENLDVFTDEYKELLELEKYYNLYSKNMMDDVENEILKLQEKVLEVVSLSKEAEILEQNYYKVSQGVKKKTISSFSDDLMEILGIQFNGLFSVSLTNLVAIGSFSLVMLFIFYNINKKRTINVNQQEKTTFKSDKNSKKKR